MAKHEIETQWMGKMQFNSLVSDHTIIMDAPLRAGGEDAGTIPKPLLLVALSGCSGMDIVKLLRNAATTLTDFSMKVSGELSRQNPIEYISIHISYECKASPADQQAVLQAVTDSQEKYCGVSHMLKKAVPVTWSIIFNDQLVFTNQPVNTPV